MVLLEHTFAKLYTKLENHNHNHHQNQTNHDYHHEQPEKLLASLHAFRCEVSKFIGQLSVDLLKPGSSSSSEIFFLSLTWIEKCFGILPFTNKAFANLVVDIDCPLSKWEVGSIEGYLSYSLCLLEIFNSVSSSLSHLSQSRLSLSHGLSLLEDSSHPSSSMVSKHLKPIELCCSNFSLNFGKELSKESDQGRIFSGKEWVVNEALKEMKSLGFWVCGILLSGLCSNNKPYMELREVLGGFDGSLVVTLDSKINEQIMEKIPVLKEVKEINDSVAQVLVDDDDSEDLKHVTAKEMQKKLQVLENLCDVVSTMVDDMFNKVMKQRTELIDCLRLKKGT